METWPVSGLPSPFAPLALQECFATPHPPGNPSTVQARHWRARPGSSIIPCIGITRCASRYFSGGSCQYPYRKGGMAGWQLPETCPGRET
ncbi:hypothetical protein BO71DRAFT_401747 [Aspergillus ellipticus CBS 707.79]|uniref:Uncharacterized protein n=1 Tax=Aspergillus ellipticus CBS 707.79 TaxID=1448320 RepID=A0A319D1Q7_9EURO|nr:hypothetical protein BO71DRAFT_401747 [Aspergillus ellipticus CBS 707.79]